VKRTDIRNLRVTDVGLDQYLEGNYPAFFVFYMSFLKAMQDEGEATKQLVALEILSKLFRQKVARISVEDMIELLPVEWQGDVVPVPLPVLEALMVPYAEYSRAPDNVTLGQAWGLEGQGTTGKRRSVRNLKVLRKDLAVALEIEELYHLEKFTGNKTVVEDLIQEVAVRRGVSESTARKAYERFKPAAREYLSRLRLFSQT
jgi:hypothetical protein